MDKIRNISNKALRLSDIPEGVSNWDDFLIFALSIDAYEAAGSVEQYYEIGKSHKEETLTDLRVCLFYEARRDYWCRGYGPNGYDPDEETAEYINSVLEKIRAIVSRGENRKSLTGSANQVPE